MEPNAHYCPLPLPVKRALKKLGQDIGDARKRRRTPTAMMAERACISRMTLVKVEKGDPAVSFGIYASVLFVLGLTSRVADLADSTHDLLGRSLEEEQLPKWIRIPKKNYDRWHSGNSSQYFLFRITPYL